MCLACLSALNGSTRTFNVSIADNLWRSHFIRLTRTVTVITSLRPCVCRIGRRVPYRNHLLILLLLLDVTVVVDKIFTNSSDNITSIAKFGRPSCGRYR